MEVKILVLESGFDVSHVLRRKDLAYLNSTYSNWKTSEMQSCQRAGISLFGAHLHEYCCDGWSSDSSEGLVKKLGV